MRNVRLLKRRAAAAVFDAFCGECDQIDALDTARELYDVIETLFEQIRYPLEQVDKFLAYSLLNDERHIEREIEIMLSGVDAVNSYRRTIEQAIDSFDLDSHTPDEADFIYDRLVELESTFDRLTAEAVADAALDIPFLIEPLQERGFETRPVDGFDIEDRFHRAASELDRIRTDQSLPSPDEMGRKELIEELRHGMQTDSDISEEPVSLRDVSLPLLDVPLDATSEEEQQGESWAAWNAHGETLTRLVHGSFSFSGGFGAVVYQRPQGTDLWLINPMIRDVSVSWRGQTWTYRRLWQHAFVLDGLIQQLLTTPTQISCPLCRHTTGRYCGGDSCGVDEYVESARKLGIEAATM
jgi:hypothetical protein